MKLRAAGLLDLSRIEEMHRSADMSMNGADAPAARLWSLLSSTLSAFLPLSQETLIYVAEDRGKVVGYVQASGGQRGLELSRAKVLQVLNLQVVDGSSDDVAPALVEHCSGSADFASTPPRSSSTPRTRSRAPSESPTASGP